MRSIGTLCISGLILGLTSVYAHELRPAYLELEQVTETDYEVLWKLPARGDLRLALYVRFPKDTEYLVEPAGQFLSSNYLERSKISHPEGLLNQTVEIEGLERTLTDVLVRVEKLDGSEQVARLTPTDASLTIVGSPGWMEQAQTYLSLGIEHILLGIDHLLFIFGLLLLVRGWKILVGTITAFTIAHSITLALSTLGVLYIPSPPVDAIIALSICFVAREVIELHRGNESLATRRPWTAAFAFGLLHGLGFAGALLDLGLPQSSIPLALLFFNVGVEIGQLLFVGVVGLVLVSLRGLSIQLPKFAPAATAYAIGGIAMFWLIERVSKF